MFTAHHDISQDEIMEFLAMANRTLAKYPEYKFLKFEKKSGSIELSEMPPDLDERFFG